MSIGWTRVGAIFRKELTEYRRSGSIISTMAVIPLVFILPPMIEILTAAPGALSLGRPPPLPARHPRYRPRRRLRLRSRGRAPAGNP